MHVAGGNTHDSMLYTCRILKHMNVMQSSQTSTQNRQFCEINNRSTKRSKTDCMIL